MFNQNQQQTMLRNQQRNETMHPENETIQAQGGLTWWSGTPPSFALRFLCKDPLFLSSKLIPVFLKPLLSVFTSKLPPDISPPLFLLFFYFFFPLLLSDNSLLRKPPPALLFTHQQAWPAITPLLLHVQCSRDPCLEKGSPHLKKKNAMKNEKRNINSPRALTLTGVYSFIRLIRNQISQKNF